MTPQFALSLFFDGIRLLHHGQDGWRVLGDVAIDSPNLDAGMQALLAIAQDLSNESPIKCKVILPDTQIKYLCIDPAGDVQATARAALRGSTPYDLSELVFDTAEQGGQLFIAAIARETLGEADGFVRAHGFVPSHFSAVPEPAIFPREPQFDGPPHAPAPQPQAEPQAASPPAEAPAPAAAAEVTPEASAQLASQALGPSMAPPGPPTDEPPAKGAVHGGTDLDPEVLARITTVRTKARRLGRAALLVGAVLLLGVTGWSSGFLGNGVARLLAPPPTTAPDPQPEPPVAPPQPKEPPLYETPRAFYRERGISIIPPVQSKAPVPVSLDGLYLTSIDPVSLRFDAVALPNVDRFLTDDAPIAIPSPPAPDTRFSFDDRGLIVPTPGGALSPDGYTVFAGKPPVLPPKVPLRFETNPLSDLERERREILAKIRPRLRPDTLRETNERAALGGLSRAELSRLRPRLRPQSAQEAAALIQPGTETTGVQSAPRPRLRPASLTGGGTPAANLPSAEPDIPTSASIARTATQKNALALGRINLIGIYGKASDRSALVRLANGRYLKVEVGDSLDGGKISAISETELRYQKSGKNHVLKMPKG